MTIPNLFADLDPPTEELRRELGRGEVVEELARTPAVRVERIVSMGHASPEGFWYDQDEDEWVVVLRGAARLELADPDGVVELNAGDHLFLPAHRRHRVAWTTPDEPTVWLAVFGRRTHAP